MTGEAVVARCINVVWFDLVQQIAAALMAQGGD